jgi:hypothetical protein
MIVHKIGNDEVIEIKIADSANKNNTILTELGEAKEFYDYSHRIQGRWENTYVPITLMPSVREIFKFASDIIHENYQKSTIITHSIPGMKDQGFWFNIMPPASQTGLHDHKSNSFMSGVYYLKVPKDSGNIIFRQADDSEITLQSEEGKMLLFPPHLKHRVSHNQSSENRISLAFNLFTLPLEV